MDHAVRVVGAGSGADHRELEGPHRLPARRRSRNGRGGQQPAHVVRGVVALERVARHQLDAVGEQRRQQVVGGAQQHVVLLPQQRRIDRRVGQLAEGRPRRRPGLGQQRPRVLEARLARAARPVGQDAHAWPPRLDAAPHPELVPRMAHHDESSPVGCLVGLTTGTCTPNTAGTDPSAAVTRSLTRLGRREHHARPHQVADQPRQLRRHGVRLSITTGRAADLANLLELRVGRHAVSP